MAITPPIAVLGLGRAEKEVGHPNLGPLNVRRWAKRLALHEHVVKGVEVLVIDLFVALVEVDHPVSSLPGHFGLPFCRHVGTSADEVTLAAGCEWGEVLGRALTQPMSLEVALGRAEWEMGKGGAARRRDRALSVAERDRVQVS